MSDYTIGTKDPNIVVDNRSHLQYNRKIIVESLYARLAILSIHFNNLKATVSLVRSTRKNTSEELVARVYDKILDEKLENYRKEIHKVAKQLVELDLENST